MRFETDPSPPSWLRGGVRHTRRLGVVLLGVGFLLPFLAGDALPSWLHEALQIGGIVCVATSLGLSRTWSPPKD